MVPVCSTPASSWPRPPAASRHSQPLHRPGAALPSWTSKALQASKASPVAPLWSLWPRCPAPRQSPAAPRHSRHSRHFHLPRSCPQRRVGASLGAGAGQDAKVKATAIGSGGARVTLQLSQASHKTYLIALQLLSVWDLCSFHGSYYVLEVCVFWHCSERG